MNNEIIVVEQLPVIKQQLQTIKDDVTERVNCALSLVCTEDSVKSVKQAKADLNREYKEWEEKRKQVKKAIMSPYEQFESIYKECITDVFNKADTELKGKVESVENELKAKKARKILDYFNEYVCSVEAVTGISLYDFVTFERANINVTLSASEKSLKEQAKAFVDRICDDLNLIGTQEHKDEIFYEYKQSLNVSNAITTVANRYKAIEEAKAREEAQNAKKEALNAVEAKVNEITPPKEVEPIVTTKFVVRGTKTQLRALKEFLNNGGYDYE